MIFNGVIISNEKNKNVVGKGLKIIKKGNGLSNVKKVSGLSNVKKYGSGLRILK